MAGAPVVAKKRAALVNNGSRPGGWGWRKINPKVARGAGGFLFVALTWELVGRYVVTSSLLFVPLSKVMAQFGLMVGSGDIWPHVQVSLLEFGLGMVLASAVGIVLGLLMGTYSWLADTLDPLVSALYSTPVAALAPLFIIWFGLGLSSKVAVVFLLAVLPILINTYSGVRSVDPSLVEVAASFNASRLQIFTKVLVPGAIPAIMSGLRLGGGRGLLGIVVGELFGARAGVGYLIFIASQNFDLATLFVGVLILAVSGVAFSEGVKALEKRYAPWRD